MLQRIVLGPQRTILNLVDAVNTAQIPSGPIAVISAGWQEGEGELEELSQLLQRPLVELNLYTRAEEIFAEDNAFQAQYRERQDRLQQLQLLYRLRLRQLMLAARQMQRQSGLASLLEIEQQHSIEQVRTLDEHLATQVESVYAEYSERLSASSNELLAEHIQSITSVVEGCSTIIVPGGNVLVLLNRLQLFGALELFKERHVVAWSAGAMVLSDLVVLYHDRTPLGRRDPEVLGSGLGIIPGHLFLPDSKKRLVEKDENKMALFSRRFAPAKCVTLNNGSLLRFEHGEIREAKKVGSINSQGCIDSLDIA